jgi:hypothetical protein
MYVVEMEVGPFTLMESGGGGNCSKSGVLARRIFRSGDFFGWCREAGLAIRRVED